MVGNYTFKIIFLTEFSFEFEEEFHREGDLDKYFDVEIINFIMKVAHSREFVQEAEKVLNFESVNYQLSKANGTMFRLHFLGSVEVEEEGGRKRRKRLKKNMVEVAVTKIKVCPSSL